MVLVTETWKSKSTFSMLCQVTFLLWTQNIFIWLLSCLQIFSWSSRLYLQFVTGLRDEYWGMEDRKILILGSPSLASPQLPALSWSRLNYILSPVPISPPPPRSWSTYKHSQPLNNHINYSIPVLRHSTVSTPIHSYSPPTHSHSLPTFFLFPVPCIRTQIILRDSTP